MDGFVSGVRLAPAPDALQRIYVVYLDRRLDRCCVSNAPEMSPFSSRLGRTVSRETPREDVPPISDAVLRRSPKGSFVVDRQDGSQVRDSTGR